VRWLRAISLGLGAIALGWLVYRIGPAALLAGLEEVGWGLLLGAALHLGGIALDAVTLRATTAGDGPRYLTALRASLAGHAINEATPGGKLGELTKFSLIENGVGGRRAAAGLIGQNLVMFTVNCGLIALAPPLALLWVGAPGAIVGIALAVTAVFLGLGAVALVLLARGLGAWPFAALRALRVPAARVARWRERFGTVEREWLSAAHTRRAMLAAGASAVASRLCNVAESATYYALAGGEHAVAAGFLSLAGSQLVSWVLFFVPFQAGSAEGGAFALFRAAGLPPESAVVVELARKLRRVGFIALGVALLMLPGPRAKAGQAPGPKGSAHPGR
jgi:hypothetical protein